MKIVPGIFLQITTRSFFYYFIFTPANVICFKTASGGHFVCWVEKRVMLRHSLCLLLHCVVVVVVVVCALLLGWRCRSHAVHTNERKDDKCLDFGEKGPVFVEFMSDLGLVFCLHLGCWFHYVFDSGTHTHWCRARTRLHTSHSHTLCSPLLWLSAGLGILMSPVLFVNAAN